MKILTTILICLMCLCSFAKEDTLLLIEKAQKAQETPSKESRLAWLDVASNLESLASQGTQNANIYTMKGNAYLFANKIGMAIYAYTNALKYAPTNAEILNNLDYAKSLCVNEIEADKKESFLKTYFYEAEFTKANALWIFLVSWNLVFIIAILKINITEIKFVGFLCAILACLFASALIYTKYCEINYVKAVVNTTDTVARKGASEIFMPAYKESLKDGTEFLILGEKNNWLHAKLRDGSSCWIKAEHAIKL